jgi:transcriptional regulator GlxA family with amidase domain
MTRAKTDSEIIENLDGARCLEQALVDAMLGCLSSADVREEWRASRRASLVDRLRAHAEAHADEAVSLSDACAAIGVRERALRRACKKQLGVGPKRYLLLRRLHLAHQALASASAKDRVTEIATRFGFLELGRFAVYYKEMFGESPSATLRRVII